MTSKNREVITTNENIENTENIICNTDSFLEAELAAEKHEAELISAMASYLGDDD